MKIGIMTFWWSNDNYGQLLQCYALQKYLRDLGHEAYLIRYQLQGDCVKDPPPPLITKVYKALNPIKVCKFVINKIKNYNKRHKLAQERKQNSRLFELFREKYIVQSPQTYNSLKELQSNPPEADIYIVGSDQVWNFYSVFDKLKTIAHAYFLDFGGDNIRRMSYAASWGRTEISDDEIKELSPLLKRFDYISVREESGIELCKKCGCNDPEWVCDPTLLLDANTYRTIYNENEIRKPESKYLLLYMLGNECDFDVETVYDFAAKKGLEVVFVSGNNLIDSHQQYFATIPEWLYLVDNAEYVITNSFHCGVFSTIFHKQFGIIPLTGKLVGMNARMLSLFELRGTDNRFVNGGEFVVLDKEYKVKDVKVSEKFFKYYA